MQPLRFHGPHCVACGDGPGGEIRDAAGHVVGRHVPEHIRRRWLQADHPELPR